MFEIMKKVLCGKIIDYQLLQEKLYALKVEHFWTQKSFDRKKKILLQNG